MDLITLEEYKESQGISSATQDARIESLITSVSALVKTYCANSIVDYYEENKCEEFNLDFRRQFVQLTEGPLRRISTVEVRDNFATDYYTLQESEFAVDHATDSVYRIIGGIKSYWPEGIGSVRISYTAGYESTPEDLKLAVIDLVTYYLKDEHKMRKTLSGATIDNQGTSSQYKNVGFPDHIKRILDLYKYH